MKKTNVSCILLLLLAMACEDDPAPTIDSPGVVKLDYIGTQGDSWALTELSVSHDGTRIVYAVNSFALDKHELRSIDESGKVSVVFKGNGRIDGLDFSPDDTKLTYSLSGGEEFGSRLYQFNLTRGISTKLLTVIGDGYFWHLHYLTDGNIVYNQGDGSVQLSVRRLNPVSKEVNVLMDKELNPILVDVDISDRLLISSWTDARTITINPDGSDLFKFEEQPTYVRAVQFSAEGDEVLAYDMGDLQAQPGTEESKNKLVTFDPATGKKNVLFSQSDRFSVLAYGVDKNEILLKNIRESSGEFALYDRASQKITPLTSNNMDEVFLGYYGNSARRILFVGAVESGRRDLYILNR